MEVREHTYVSYEVVVARPRAGSDGSKGGGWGRDSRQASRQGVERPESADGGSAIVGGMEVPVKGGCEKRSGEGGRSWRGYGGRVTGLMTTAPVPGTEKARRGAKPNRATEGCSWRKAS